MIWRDCQQVNYKRLVQNVFNKFGYEIHKAGEGSEYTACSPYGYTTYSPWFEDWFQDIYDNVRNRTLVKEDRCYILHRFARHCAHLDGDYAECGVYKGGTAFLTALSLSGGGPPTKQLHLFDTFAGMPDEANTDDSGHKQGDFGDTNLNDVKNYLQEFSFISFYPGLIPQTFASIAEKTFAFAHIDVDLYQTSLDCCRFFYDRMTSGGAMIFDDYGFPGYKLAQKLAVDEFFSDKPEEPIALRTGQCLVIKV